VLSEDHPDAFTNMSNLAETYMEIARFQEAEDLQIKASQIRERLLGPDHPNTWTYMVLVGFRVGSSRGVGLGLSGGATFTLLLVYVSNK